VLTVDLNGGVKRRYTAAQGLTFCRLHFKFL